MTASTGVPAQRSASAAEAPPCPRWCTKPAGHDWPVTDLMQGCRSHYLRYADEYGDDGLGQVFVAAYGEVNDDDFSPRIQIDIAGGLSVEETAALIVDLHGLMYTIGSGTGVALATPQPGPIASAEPA